MTRLKENISSPNWHPEIELLLDFLGGTLDEESHRLLNSHIENCEICQSTLLGLEAQLIEHPDKKALTKKIDQTAERAYQQFNQHKKAYKQPQSTSKRRIIPLLSIVSAVAAALLLFFMTRGIQIAYLPADEPFVDERTISKGAAQDYEKGIIKYNEKQFEIAERLFLRADTITANHYLGLIELKTGDADKAKGYFEALLKGATEEWRYIAAFYLVQITYSQKNYDDCRKWLTILQEDATLFSQKAIQEIKRKIEK